MRDVSSANYLNISPEDILNNSVWSTNSDFSDSDIIPNVHKLSCVTQTTYNTQGILIDTGASCHILSDKSYFKNFNAKFVPSENYLEMADGSRRNDLIKGKGDAIIPLYDESGIQRNFILKSALYVPSFNKNIMSLYNAVQDRVQFNFNAPGEEHMITKNGIVFKIKTSGHLYIVNSVISKSPVQRSTEDWHRALGHCNYRDVLKLPPVVTNMKIKGQPPKDTCETCIMAKFNQYFNREPQEKCSEPFQSIHIDLSGPHPDENIGDFKFIFGAVCEYSGYLSVYLLKSKSDCDQAMKHFLAQNSTYGTVKKIRTDFGTEFLSNKFEQILLDKGIRHEKSSPYSPSQNGSVERSWRTIFNMARALMTDSNLPRHLWTFAIKMAAYLRNRCYNERLNATPLEAATGKRPDFRRLHIFGSKCFAYQQHRKKLDPKALPGVFLGYHDSSPAHIIYYPENGKISLVRCVSFTDKPYFSNTSESGNTYYFIEEIPYLTTTGSVGTSGSTQTKTNNDLETGTQSRTNTPDNSVPSDQQSEPISKTSTRYPNRSRKQVKYLGVSQEDELDNDCQINSCHFIQNLNVCNTIINVPNTYKQAILSPESSDWAKAMDVEMDSLIANNTFDLVPLPHGRQLVGGRWTYKASKDPSNDISFKARYVAKGFSQSPGIDFNETYAPTAKPTSVKMIVNISAQDKLVAHQADCSNAYLNSDIDHEIYMKQPEGYVQGENLVCRLNKSIYGLKQSAHLWNSTLVKFMKTQNLEQSKIDPCVFIRKTKQEALYVLIWVDDLIIAGSSLNIVNEFKANFGSRFKIKDLGELKWFLGIQFDISDSVIKMNQSLYVQSILERFNMSNCSPRTLPCDPSVYHLLEEKSDPLQDARKYRELVGSLIYLMTGTRPDLAFVVCLLSRFMQNPTNVHMTLALGVLKYLKHTSHYDLKYVRSRESLKITGYSDSDFASDSDRRSFSGYCFKLNENSALLSWRSCKQSLVATSTCESEYIALHEATNEALFLRQLFAELTKLPMQTVNIFADNQGSICLTDHQTCHKRTKHISVKYHATRDYVAKKYVKITYIPTNLNIADLFTKPLPGPKLKSFEIIRGKIL